MKYKRRQDRESHLIGRLIWNVALDSSQYHGKREIELTDYGRPVWPLEKGDASISHSAHWVVVAVSDSGSVGIDIEKKSRVDIREFRNGFSDDEWAGIIADSDSQLDVFYEMWTKKEAIIKADARGWSNEKESITWQKKTAILNQKNYYISTVDRFNEYACHIASSSNHESQIEYTELTRLERGRL